MTADLLLRRALERSADAAAVALTFRRGALIRWASATFAGARHELVLELAASGPAEQWVANLPEADLPMPGHLVADLKVIGATRDAGGLSVMLEILTVEDR